MSVLTTKINNQPAIISDDILVFDPNTGVGGYANTLSGSFTYPSGDKPCSIMINKGTDIFSYACHSWLGFPETVIYRYKDGKFGIGKFKSTTEIPNRANVLWAVGGLGLLDKYNPSEEGFKTGVSSTGQSYNYTDVLRDTNHTLLGIKDNKCYLIYLISMTATEVNNYAKNYGFQYAIMLDGGHIAAINGSETYAKINLTTKQGYAIQGISANFGTTAPTTSTPSTPIPTTPITSVKFLTNLTLTNFNTGRSGSDIEYIVVHYTANDGDTDESNAMYFHSIDRQASAHRFVDEDSITMVVKDEDTAWHCNDTQRYTNGGATYKALCNNKNSIGIEMCSDKVDGDFVLTESTQKNTQELIRLLLIKHNLTIDKVIRHFDVSGKICPEPFVMHPEQWTSFKKGIITPNTPVPILTGTIFKVQVGAFSIRANAEKLRDELISKGYNTMMALVNGLWKVQVGAFSVQANAIKLEAELKSKGYATMIKEVK